ncbi:hypothetical protein FH972_017154 [Carpinus fangiana]|uniref:PH domain-containing protein n=1 Tax=Carpinus fangiana TaxID=176857 RepID=A0A5N6RLX9_9ROSI|nr:hypothetical protein FH972_017154 [Carpinus fangiana]
MHPLCCISLESPGESVGDRSTSSSLWRARSSPTGFPGKFADNAGGSESSVARVLSKWTNHGKGWRSRWFVLMNNVVSYAKIRRPENLNLLTLATDDVRLIGEISADRLSRMDSGRLKHWKDVGIVHLKEEISFICKILVYISCCF